MCHNKIFINRRSLRHLCVLDEHAAHPGHFITDDVVQFCDAPRTPARPNRGARAVASGVFGDVATC